MTDELYLEFSLHDNFRVRQGFFDVSVHDNMPVREEAAHWTVMAYMPSMPSMAVMAVRRVKGQGNVPSLHSKQKRRLCSGLGLTTSPRHDTRHSLVAGRSSKGSGD